MIGGSLMSRSRIVPVLAALLALGAAGDAACGEIVLLDPLGSPLAPTGRPDRGRSMLDLQPAAPGAIIVVPDSAKAKARHGTAKTCTSMVVGSFDGGATTKDVHVLSNTCR
jgi:hypothetical protein